MALHPPEQLQPPPPIAQLAAHPMQLLFIHGPGTSSDLEAARLLVYNASRMKEAGMPVVKEAAMAKLFATVTAEQVASQAIDLFGGNGVVKDYPVEKFYRDARVVQIYEGTSNLQLKTIASQLLKTRR